jgi:type I restriction enzyme S subunit
VKLSEVAKGIYDGPHATPPPCDTPGYYFLGIPQITPSGHIDLANPRYIAEEDYAKWTKRVVPREGDVIFSYEATLNLYAMIPKDMRCCLGRRMGLVRPDAAKLDSRFLYYYFFSPEWRKTVVENTVVGATVDRLPIKTFPSFPIFLPPLPVQRRIADILSAYDDLIENNRRRIAILEETARLAYRKWLSENYALIKTTKIGEFVDLQNGFAFKSNTFVAAGQYKIITIKNVKDVIVDSGNVAFVESIPARMPAHCRILPKDILLSLTGNVGRVSIAIEQNGLLNQRVAKVKSDFPWFSLLVLKSNECFRLMNNLAVGTAQQNLSPVKLCDEFIEVPTRTGMAHVERLVAPLFDHIVLLAQQSVALAAARDMLLPRLMKGQPCFSSL